MGNCCSNRDTAGQMGATGILPVRIGYKTSMPQEPERFSGAGYGKNPNLSQRPRELLVPVDACANRLQLKRVPPHRRPVVLKQRRRLMSPSAI